MEDNKSESHAKEHKKDGKHSEEHAHKKHHSSHKISRKKDMMKSPALWQAVSAILLIAVVVFAMRGTGAESCGAEVASITEKEAGENVIDFINTKLLTDGRQAELSNSTSEGSLYRVSFTLEGQEYISYLSADGSRFFPEEGIEIESFEMQPSQPQQAPEVAKAEKPVVEVFVMSHCPYGTQIEKGLIPVVKTLGDDIDFRLRFVNYAMHGKKEIDEQLLQHCIQEEMPSKLVPYLECFLEAGETDSCLEKTGIDKSELDTCISETDKEFSITENFEDQSTWLNGRFPKFDVDALLNTKYGVRGSPHLVINGGTASAGRDSASLLAAVCAGFVDQPDACSKELSASTPSPGFGYGTAGSSGSAGSCS